MACTSDCFEMWELQVNISGKLLAGIMKVQLTLRNLVHFVLLIFYVSCTLYWVLINLVLFQVLARGGYGAIIRVFCDRQRL